MARTSKRRAEEPLEDTVPSDSPASKKVRMQEVADGNIPPPPPPEPTNGNATTNGAPDIADADRDIHNELEEANALEDDEQENAAPRARHKVPEAGYEELYLDTIKREVHDYDFEKLCSVTLSAQNVYACLVCGKYFSGRGTKTPAYFHALEVNHHVYINMETKKVYVLPEGYEVKSKSLDDIKFNVDPRFTPPEVKALDRSRQPAWDLQDKKYHPGFVGLNNIKANDYHNVVVQALAHVPPLRNFFLLEDLSSRPQIAQRFSILVRKMWNSKAFKSHVSPHELLQEISSRSNKRFNLTQQADPVDFLSWFLNTLHLSLGGSKTKPHSSLIQRIFQGTLHMESQKITTLADTEQDRLRFENTAINAQTTPFMILTLDLPPAPLFQDDTASNIIPQVPLKTLLQKYNGTSTQERQDTRLRYRLRHPLPPYLIMHVKRFAPNKFLQAQRNPTIVTFSPRALDLAPYTDPATLPTGQAKDDPVFYDLVANITYEGVKVRDDSVEGEAERKVWKAQVRDSSGTSDGKEGERWWEMQDLYVREVNAELLSSKESYVMVWERRKRK